MAVQLLTPFTQVFRRSAPKDTADLLTGRWVAIGSTGKAAVPGGGAKVGLNLVIEGNKGHKGTNLEFGNAGTGYASTNYFTLPSVAQSGEVALAYGVFRYQVGPEGCDPTAHASLAVDALVAVDAYGRIIPVGDGVAIGKVEAISTDANGVTLLTIRTFGN